MVTDESNSTENDWFSPEAATFGDRIAGAREVANMTQSELARRIGVNISTLRAWEDDRSEPRANRLQMLSGLLNVSMRWLLNGEGKGLEEPTDDTPLNADMKDLLLELRSVKTEMTKSADRLARLEKRLRLAMANG